MATARVIRPATQLVTEQVTISSPAITAHVEEVAVGEQGQHGVIPGQVPCPATTGDASRTREPGRLPVEPRHEQLVELLAEVERVQVALVDDDELPRWDVRGDTEE